MSGKDELENKTKGVETLLGNPKKAILKLSIPMIIAMSVQTLYNLADGIWVAGLGKDEMAAVGFFFPFFFLIMALAGGLGIGGGAAISRRIGANDKKGAGNVADHTIILMLVIALVFTLPITFFLGDIIHLIGGGEVQELALEYGRIIVMFSLIIFFSNIANAILRAEGDTKRAMYAMILGSVLNIVLDPIFIYVLDLGIAGAAWATMVSFGITGALLFYWLFICKDTFVRIRLRQFRFKMVIFNDIMRVALPASLQQMAMSFNMMFLNGIVAFVGGVAGVAIFSTGWRVVMVATLPLMGIASALVPVAGAAFGARKFRKLRLSLYHSIRYGLMMEIFLCILIFAFAGIIVLAFTWSEDSADLRPGMITFLRFFSLMPFAAAFGMFSGSTFQAIGKGFYSLIVTILRTIILALTFAWLFGIYLDWGLEGVWIGILTGNAIASTIAYLWARGYIHGLVNGRIKPDIREYE